MAETVKTIENVDRLFSQIIVNGEVHESSNYVPPVVPQQNAPVIETPEEQSSQNNNQGAQQSTQGEDVYAVELNDVLHNFVDQAVTQGLAEEVTARETADTGLDERLDTIEAVIPSSASPSNKLVDQDSIGTIAEEVATQTVNGIIADLDFSEAGGNGKYIKAISESNGKISATEGTIDSSVSSGSENPVTGGAVNTAIESAVNALDVSEAGGNGKYIKAISEADGKISATEGTIDSSVTAGSGNPVSSDAVSTAIGAIETNVGDIEELIPEQASAENQLADKDFVNSSIASNTANFIGTFESVVQLQAYTGTVTNNDYAFVRNTVVQYNGGDFPNVTTLNNYSKTGLTNGDYAWVVNTEDNTKFDLYKFDIIEQTWLLRATKIDKPLDILNAVFNRYKATVSGSTVTWAYEYTLNNSSFTAEQWATINSGLTSTSISDAINALDVSEKGGNGKYIKAISEADGKISATEGTIDSSVTSGSSNPVTGGAVYTGLDGKVDKVAGKGLSTNDFTDTLKDKLDGIESGAQVNSVTGVKGNSESSYRTGNVNITKSNIGLGNVVNTGDSATPVSGGTTKFTTGGAYNLLLNLASAFDTATAYTVGSYVIYNGSLYKCVVDHTAGAWNSTHFTAVNVGDEIEQLDEVMASLPTDAVLHYSFDEVPDYPDGSADVRLLNNNTYDIQSTNYEFLDVNEHGTTFANANGKLQITIPSGGVDYGTQMRNAYIVNKIIKFKINITSLSGTIRVKDGTGTGGITIAEITKIGVYELEFLHSSSATYNDLYILTANNVSSATFTIEQIYIGDGSYSTPIIDNANGQNNATNNGGIAVQGVSGKGAYFLEGKYADLGTDFQIPSNFSISLWINPSNNTTDKREIIIGKANSILLFNGANNDNNLIIYFYSNSQSNRYLLRQDLLTPNVWHFVVITKNGTQLKCYINGVLVNTLTCVESIDQNSNSFNIGFSTNERSDTKDDFQLFNRALSEIEVQALYLNKANTPKYYTKADMIEINPSSVETGTVISTMGSVPQGYLDCGKHMIDKFVQNSSFPTSYSVHSLLQTADGAIYAGTNVHGIYKSTDGSNFIQLSGFPTTATTERLLQTADGAIYAGTNDGIYKSTDGNTFTQLSGFPTNYFVLSLLQSTDGTIYAGTSVHGIYKSTDGNTFTQLSGFPTNYSVLSLLQTADGTIYAGTRSHGIYKSTDGSTFTQLSGFPTSYDVPSLSQSTDGTIYAGTSTYGIYKSTDGSTFTQLSGFPTIYSPYIFLQTADGTIYAGTNDGIYKSTDGSTFTQLSGFPSYIVEFLLQTTDGAVYVGTISHGIYKSALFMELSKTTYADLYAVIGDRYKAKAGVTDNTKFAIPLVGNDDLTYAVKT